MRPLHRPAAGFFACGNRSGASGSARLAEGTAFGGAPGILAPSQFCSCRPIFGRLRPCDPPAVSQSSTPIIFYRESGRPKSFGKQGGGRSRRFAAAPGLSPGRQAVLSLSQAKPMLPWGLASSRSSAAARWRLGRRSRFSSSRRRAAVASDAVPLVGFCCPSAYLTSAPTPIRRFIESGLRTSVPA